MGKLKRESLKPQHNDYVLIKFKKNELDICEITYIYNKNQA